MDDQLREEDRMLQNQRIGLASIVVCMSTSVGVAQVQQSPEQHGQWASLNAEWEAPSESAQVTVDGKLLPERFHLPLSRRMGLNLAEAGPLTFVLIRPGQVTIDGVELDVERPFYIAATEMSLAQFAQLNGATVLEYSTYDEFRRMVVWRARLEPRVSVDVLKPLATYLENPNNPALRVDASSAASRIAQLSEQSGFRVRLPTLGEWFHAARCGEPTLFWWGDSMDEGKLAWLGDAPTDVETALAGFEEVEVGDPNPWGLRHTFGNAAELALPGKGELEVLRHHDTHLAPGVPVAVGGAVTTRGVGFGSLAQAKKHFVEEVSQWFQIADYQLTEEINWGADIWWTTGLRLVIDVPDGEVQLLGDPGSERGR